VAATRRLQDHRAFQAVVEPGVDVRHAFAEACDRFDAINGDPAERPWRSLDIWSVGVPRRQWGDGEDVASVWQACQEESSMIENDPLGVTRDNDPTGQLRALDEIEALRKELRDQRLEFEAQIKSIKTCLENIVECLKGTASRGEIEQVREEIIVASDMVRSNIADVVVAAAERMRGP
jgi:hypothetical protein